ncbi:MAG: thiol peroxidase [Acidobacteriota bacterium]|nr:thiol peroxidase [Acidobacteriota bacterium]
MATQTERARTTILQGNDFKLKGPELKTGDKAPDFDVVNDSLQRVNLAKTGSGVRIFSVVPSLDTPVCDAQTKRFEEATAQLPDVSIYTISMDLPFAQKRWCGSFGVKNVAMLSDHKTGSFGENYGTLIPDLRIESRAIFVLDPENTIRHVEYVKAVGDHPDYEAALSAAKAAQKATTKA